MRLGIFWGAVVGLVLATSCEKAEEKPILHEQIATKTPLTFPNMPDFAGAVSLASESHGVYSPWGLIYHRDKLLNAQVHVKGKIVEVSRDCPDLTVPKVKTKRGKRIVEEAQPKKCLALWVAIGDEQGHRVKIVGYHPYYQPHLTVGMDLDVTGQYAESATVMGMTYAEPETGLVVAANLNGMGVSWKGEFTTNRALISKMSLNGELAEAPTYRAEKGHNEQ